MSETGKVEEKVDKLNCHLACHYKATQELAEIINEKVPEEKRIAISEINKDDSIKENTSNLVLFIQRIKDFVQELDKSLEGVLSPEDYAKVAKVTATTEQVLDIIKTVTSGLVSLVGPLVSTIARKLMSTELLNKLEDRIGMVSETKVVQVLHTAHGDVSHPDIQDNIKELDDAIETLKPDEKNNFDLASTVSHIVMFAKWHDKTFND